MRDRDEYFDGDRRQEWFSGVDRVRLIAIKYNLVGDRCPAIAIRTWSRWTSSIFAVNKSARDWRGEREEEEEE